MVGGVRQMMLVAVTVVVVVAVVMVVTVVVGDVDHLGDPSSALWCQDYLHLLPGKTSRITCVKEEKSVSLKCSVMVEVPLES